MTGYCCAPEVFGRVAGCSSRVTVAFAPQNGRRGKRPTARMDRDSFHGRIAGSLHSRKTHRRREPRPPRLSSFRRCQHARVYAQDKCVLQSSRGGYTSVRELFAKRTEEPGGWSADDVVPRRVRFPDGHAPRSALSEGDCRRRRYRCCFCYSRRCIHRREVVATGGVAEGYLPFVLSLSCSPPLLRTALHSRLSRAIFARSCQLDFTFHRRLHRFYYHRIKYSHVNRRRLQSQL